MSKLFADQLYVGLILNQIEHMNNVIDLAFYTGSLEMMMHKSKVSLLNLINI